MTRLTYQLNHVVAVDPRGPDPAQLPHGYRLDRLGDADLQAMSAHPAAIVRKAAGFAARGSMGFVLRMPDGRACASAIFAPPERFRRRDIVTPGPNEWILVELVTWPEQQGRGLGTLMVQHGSRAMFDAGALRLLSFMWWSHRASLRVFLKAGWRRVGFSACLGNPRAPWLAVRLPAWLAPGA